MEIESYSSKYRCPLCACLCVCVCVCVCVFVFVKCDMTVFILLSSRKRLAPLVTLNFSPNVFRMAGTDLGFIAN